MSVLDGPREEWRRILHEGQPQWVKPEGEYPLLGDGRRIAEAEATYLPPCEPRWQAALYKTVGHDTKG
jgi:5-oxopent-3-ene-1,2,5-tricarboxylate decarboxylase/2-hydroxyhepta-2,4-diene-1,7-dioate isomerase